MVVQWWKMFPRFNCPGQCRREYHGARFEDESVDNNNNNETLKYTDSRTNVVAMRLSRRLSGSKRDGNWGWRGRCWKGRAGGTREIERDCQSSGVEIERGAMADWAAGTKCVIQGVALAGLNVVLGGKTLLRCRFECCTVPAIVVGSRGAASSMITVWSWLCLG